MSLLDLLSEFDAALEWPVDVTLCDDPLLGEPTPDLPPVLAAGSSSPAAPPRVT